MNWPPMLLHLKFPTKESYWCLWFPLFLIYPLLFILALVAIPFLIIAALVLWPSGKEKIPLLIIPYAWDVISKTRGLVLDVQGDGRDVFINFV